MFEGFTLSMIDIGEVKLRVRHGGSGPPLLLLHGHPQTHVMWHAVAPALAERFTVVAPDLRGYGESSKPETTPDHEPYSKRAMARDQVELMRQLGFERFSVCGHDRGARVAYRLALDTPAAVERLAVLGLVLWGGRGRLAELYEDVLAIWRDWAGDVRGAPLDCGHFLAEEAPEQTLRELLAFFEPG